MSERKSAQKRRGIIVSHVICRCTASISPVNHARSQSVAKFLATFGFLRCIIMLRRPNNNRRRGQRRRPKQGARNRTTSVSSNLDNVRRVTPVSLVPMPLFPRWDTKFTQGMKFRFLSTGTASGSGTPVTVIHVFGLLAMSLLSAVAPTTFYGIIDAFRIKKFRILDSGGQPVSITWSPTQFSRVVTETADGNASTNPTLLVSRPPAMSTWSFWQDAGSSGTICSIVCSNTAIVELEISASINGPGNSGVITNTSTSGVQGTIYFFPLDGPAIAPVFPSACPTSFRAN